MKYFTYIIFSSSLNKLYIGQSNNVIRRLQFHNDGFNKYTSRTSDWIPVFIKSFSTRSEAMLFESFLKKKKSKSFLQYIIDSDQNEINEYYN